MNCVKKFNEIYGKEPTGVSFCPYRICPVGAHSDHQYGKITGFAIDKGKVRRVEPNVVLIGKFSAIGHQNARLYVSIGSAFSTL